MAENTFKLHTVNESILLAPSSRRCEFPLSSPHGELQAVT